MTDEQLAAIRARYEATTQGRWSIGHILLHPDLHRSVHDVNGWMIANCDFQTRPATETEANVVFIAYAHEDVPALLAEIARLRDQLGCAELSFRQCDSDRREFANEIARLKKAQ